MAPPANLPRNLASDAPPARDGRTFAP